VLNFNQRSVREILDMISTLSRLVGKAADGLALIERLLDGLAQIKASARRFPHRPRVFFEEWKDPLISGIAWVEELIEIAGGDVIFPELRTCGKSQDRIVDPAVVTARDPEVIIASWCGMKVNMPDIVSRPDWSSISAVRNGHVFELQSSCILQPGPAALTEGVRRIHAILAHVAGVSVAPALHTTEEFDRQLL
jgi:iron complex transport system substrate-binding protein